MSSSHSMFQFTLQIYLIYLSQVHITTLQKFFEAVRVYNFFFNFINSSISNDCEPTYRYNSREISAIFCSQRSIDFSRFGYQY